MLFNTELDNYLKGGGGAAMANGDLIDVGAIKILMNEAEINSLIRDFLINLLIKSDMIDILIRENKGII